MLRLRRIVGILMFLVFVGSTAIWWTTRDSIPKEIRIATAYRGGLYHRFATVFAERLREETGRKVTLVESRGSGDNVRLLENGEAELAILQAGAVSFEDVSVLAPLYPAVMHVVVPRDSTIEDIPDLAGHELAIGLDGSGMRESALKILSHYGVDEGDLAGSDHYFGDLAGDENVDAAIVTTGLGNPDLQQLLASGRFELMQLLDAEAIAVQFPLFRRFIIPRGLFLARPPIPEAPLETVATTSVLAATNDVSIKLLRACLDALYAQDLRGDVPMMIPEQEAVERAPAPLHPESRSYFNPYEGLSTLTSFVEALSGIKELLFGLAALIFVVWDSRRRKAEKRREVDLKHQKEMLDELLQRTVEIERAQMQTESRDELSRHLDAITQIKLEAIDELTHEDLRGDRMFLIFLVQCSNLTLKIQGRISQLVTAEN